MSFQAVKRIRELVPSGVVNASSRLDTIVSIATPDSIIAARKGGFFRIDVTSISMLMAVLEIPLSQEDNSYLTSLLALFRLRFRRK